MLKTFLSAVILSLLLAGCGQNNVTEDDAFKQYFDAAGVAGTFGMFDNGQGNFTIYNLPRYRDSAYQPAATFDIIQSLVAVQTGVLNNDSALIEGFPGSRTDSMSAKISHIITDSELCRAPMPLYKAFRWGCTNAFQGLAQKIGKDTLKKWIDSMGYGNKDMTGDNFWQDNHLAVKADEQLGLMKKLYFDQLPFFPRSQKVVRSMMLVENNSNYRLSYKTGTGVRRDGHDFAWFVGWVEENKHPYFFVMNLDTADPGKDLNASGLSILKGILRKMGFFEGKK